MQYTSVSPEEYIRTLPADRQGPIRKLREEILKKIPKGFKEEMSYGMIGYVVPHSLYPAGYHCDPSLPLPFLSIASQKNFIAVYHMGVYADTELLDWFNREYQKKSTVKLDMGKSCIRFKKPETIPYEFIGELAGKLSVADWIGIYEKNIKKSK